MPRYMPRNKFHKKSNRKKRTKRTNRINIKAGGINNLSNKDSNRDFFIKIGKKVKESKEILKKINPIIKILNLLKTQYLDILADKLREKSDNSDLYIQNILNDTKQRNDTKQSIQTGAGEAGVEEFGHAMLFLIGIAVYLYNAGYRNRSFGEILDDIVHIVDIVTRED